MALPAVRLLRRLHPRQNYRCRQHAALAGGSVTHRRFCLHSPSRGKKDRYTYNPPERATIRIAACCCKLPEQTRFCLRCWAGHHRGRWRAVYPHHHSALAFCRVPGCNGPRDQGPKPQGAPGERSDDLAAGAGYGLAHMHKTTIPSGRACSLPQYWDSLPNLELLGMCTGG